MRWFVFSLVLLASIGCQQSSAFDPFSAYGPTTITPPPTGTAGRPDPYYRRTLSSNTNGSGRSAQALFTSHQNSGRVDVADQRSRPAEYHGNNSTIQWRSPINDDYTNDPFSSEVVGSGRVRPRLPSSRRLGRLSSNPVDEPVILNQNVVGASGALDGSYQGLPPTPPADRQVAPATFQQPVNSSGWQSRY